MCNTKEALKKLAKLKEAQARLDELTDKLGEALRIKELVPHAFDNGPIKLTAHTIYPHEERTATIRDQHDKVVAELNGAQYAYVKTGKWGKKKEYNKRWRQSYERM